MSEERTDWIDHDGKGYPYEIIKAMVARGYSRLNCWVATPGRIDTPKEQATGSIDPEHPGWTWKRSGWFGRGYWISSDPEYARIIKYRFIKPKADEAERSESVELLRSIAKGDKQPVQEDTPAEVKA